jgi:hypothetical protein
MALRVLWIAKDIQLIAVFSGRNITQRKGRTDHVTALRANRMHVLNHLTA